MSRINYPIWQDADIHQTGRTLQHLVNGSWQDTDMRICAVPEGYEPDARINRFVENDLKSTKPDLSLDSGITAQPYAYQVYKFEGTDAEVGFINDWSYEEWSGEQRCLSAPINRHADARQKLVYGNFAETGNSIIVKEMVQADIKMQPTAITISAEQYQAITIVVTSNTYFELILPEWLTASQSAFTSGTTVAYLYPQTNTSFDSRQFTIQAKHENYWGSDYEYTNLGQVYQSGKVAYWTIYPNPVDMAWDASGLTSVTVYTNTDFSVSTTGSTSWFTYSGKTGTGTNYYNTYFNVSANTGNKRTAYADFEFIVDKTGGTQSEVVAFKQMADPTTAYKIFYTVSPAQTIAPLVTEGFGANYIGSYHVGSDYFWAFESEPTAIPPAAFAGLAMIRSITAPESVTSIGYSAFTQGNLSSFVAPGVTTIGAFAFSGNKSLSNVDFSGLTSVGAAAFFNCSALTSLDLTQIEYLGESAFRNCENLSNVELGSDLRYVPTSCFSRCSGLTSMAIPEGVTGISWQVFERCDNLSSVTLPDTLIELGLENGWGGTFYLAYGLTSLTIPDGVKRIYGELCYGNGIITAVTIPDSVEYLDAACLEHFSGLKNLTIGARFIPRRTSSIYGNTLDTITITTGVTEIRDYAFGSETSATTFNYTGTKAQWGQITKGKEWAICGTIIHCSNGDVNAAEPVLNYVTTDNNAISPRNATGDSSYCSNIRVSSYNFTISDIGGHWDIPDKAFSGYTNLQSVEITNASFKNNYSTYNFSGCTNLESITFGTNVTLIPQGCCYGCSSLSSVTMGNNVKVINSGAFRECSALPSVTIPDSVTSITEQAFYVCTALSSVTIGSGVTEIGNVAFGRCVNLTEINYNNTMAQWENISKGENWDEWVPAMSIHCTDGDIYINHKITFTTAYNYPTPALRETTGYGANLIEYHFDIDNEIGVIIFDGAITSIPSSALSRNNMIDTINIPYTVTSIRDSAFRRCGGLNTINYNGTISQWNSITKGSGWNTDVPATEVHCIDGDVPI